MKVYNKITITSSPFDSEFLNGLLWQFNPDGIEENDNSLIFYSQNGNDNLASINNLLDKLKTEKIISHFTIMEEILEDKNWNEDWEKTIIPIEVSEQIVIKPTFRDYEKKPGQLIITIDPKMSFGTGEHQTTKLVLQLLEKIDLNNKYILDAGTGTGILAIASILLGAKKAVAFDNDEWCYENGIENCQLNNVTEKVDIRFCELSDISENNFDIVIANIHKSVLIEIAEELSSKVINNGTLILSGLLINDENDIVTLYNKFGMELLNKKSLDEWIVLLFEKIK